MVVPCAAMADGPTGAAPSRLVAGVRHPPGVPQLHDDDAAARMHRIDHAAPAGHLRGVWMPGT